MQFYIGIVVLILFGLFGILIVVKECIRSNAKAKIYKELAEQRRREQEREIIQSRFDN